MCFESKVLKRGRWLNKLDYRVFSSRGGTMLDYRLVCADEILKLYSERGAK